LNAVSLKSGASARRSSYDHRNPNFPQRNTPDWPGFSRSRNTPRSKVSSSNNTTMQTDHKNQGHSPQTPTLRQLWALYLLNEIDEEAFLYTMLCDSGLFDDYLL